MSATRYHCSLLCDIKNSPGTYEAMLRVKISSCLIKHQAMKSDGGVGVQLQAFLTSARDGG